MRSRDELLLENGIVNSHVVPKGLLKGNVYMPSPNTRTETQRYSQKLLVSNVSYQTRLGYPQVHLESLGYVESQMT